MAITNFAPFFILLCLCLFGFGNTDFDLPPDEVDALGEVLSKMGIVPTPSFSRPSYCDNPNEGVYAVTIWCNCGDNNKTCHVSDIMLDAGGTGGYIDPSIGRLKYLENLYVANNQLSGGLPDAIGNLTRLQSMYIGSNQLSGSIPYTIGNLQSLELLYLHRNLFTGQIPSSIGNISFLRRLVLHGNMLSGSIPSTLGSLSNLLTMKLEQNQLSGSIPSELGNLYSLEQLRLQENQLTGKLPEELGNLANLAQLDASSNYLTGVVPPSYKRLTSIILFALAGNNLNGPIPNFITNWTNLTTLFLSGNGFEGKLFPEIFNMSNLRELWVSDLNNSGFTFPNRSHANMTNIYSLVLRNCSINGQIPEYIGNWSSLKYLDLSFNNLTGEIPESLKALNLSIMDLSYNNFASSNDFLIGKKSSGKKLNRNEILNMSNTSCGGKSKYNSLFINCGGGQLEVEGNEYENDTSKSNFFVSEKRNWAYTCCSGQFWLPSGNSSFPISNSTTSLYETTRCCPVALTYYAFCLHKGDYIVELHFIDNDTNVWKRIFDVYIQDVRVLSNLDIKREAGGPYQVLVKRFSITVNDSLLKIQLYWAGKGSLYNPVGRNGPILAALSVTPRKNRKKLSSWQIAVITLGSILTPLIVLAFIWKLVWLRNKELNEKVIRFAGREITLRQIINATQNFSPKVQIGEGHLGKIYKAQLPDLTLAVKKISPELKEKQQNLLQREIFNLTSMRHENLVQLLGGYSGKNLSLLIYEYMENGSLSQALFEPKSSAIDWKTRYGICLGIAKGLKYLHEEKQSNIIHGNVKASKILLDKDFTAKLSGFGLATVYEDDPIFMSLKARGSLAYMAPERVTQRSITVQADVYSFGIVMLEIVSGRSVEYERYKEHYEFLVDRACVLHANGRILDLVDEELRSTEYDRYETMTILELAMKCINPVPTLRPTISEIVAALQNRSTST
ncbi:hypothetical protein JCGZ_16252 [Jatropha curcas]|uniref:non-specific serine/threonine protein kinase n=1 Tax=Jatropha curcas TaxID=180498 RepID=A0A067KFH5_JATCU|nr:probable LRR receptor-like serine/threonine-protein kinase At1g53440 isoform X2 [Jatropha curcas]KDP30599.1 hypothetical protein JCGZ_16252 [Jatropha curcas]